MKMEYIIAVLIMIAADVATGFLKALRNGEVKSSVMKQGLLSKTSEILVMVLMYIIDIGAPFVGININLPLVQVVGIYICIMELASVIENVGAVNPQLSKKLSNIFQDFTKDNGEDNDNA